MEVRNQTDGNPSDEKLVSRQDMPEHVRKLRDNFAFVSGAPFYQKEFGFYCKDRWKKEGHITDDMDLEELFGFDPKAQFVFNNLGWCASPFMPEFEVKVLEDRGDHEVVQDTAGRHVLYFKNRRSGFMPEYLDNPVKDTKTWEEKCKWRLDPNSPERIERTDRMIEDSREAVAKGFRVVQQAVGGYMYLRSLIGPEKLLYMFYDDPDLIHDCMQHWLLLGDAMTARIQKYVTYDEFFIAEDICYNHGSLISHDMMRDFLFPYYQQLISNIRSRQLDKERHLYIQVDTDGNAEPVIPVYREIGMDVMSPFEVASGCDVVEIAKRYPNLVMTGGIDKRILATTPEAIDRELQRILPVMRKRGGYIPTCDHGVPEEVSFENYLHYRKRCLELGN